MTCEDVARNEIAEQYVAGRLAGADQEAYEVRTFSAAPNASITCNCFRESEPISLAGPPVFTIRFDGQRPPLP